MLRICRHGLSAESVERMIRFALTQLVHRLAEQDDLDPHQRATVHAQLTDNASRMKEIDPRIPWVCEYAARYQYHCTKSPGQAMQVTCQHLPTATCPVTNGWPLETTVPLLSHASQQALHGMLPQSSA